MVVSQHCLFSLILVAPVLTWSAFAQEPKPSFEVVSIRPGDSSPRALVTVQGGPGTPDPERVAFSNITLQQAVSLAYGMRPNHVFGPKWIAEVKYDISAKIPPGTTKEQYNRMLQDLFQQRFHMQAHLETKDFKAYNLVEAKSGLKLKDAVSTDTCTAGVRQANGMCSTGGVPVNGIARSAGNAKPGWNATTMVAAGRSVTMALIAQALQTRMQGLQVFDKTGIAGAYDFRVEFASDDFGGQGDRDLPNIFTAVEKELGLKLEPVIVSQDTLVIDSVSQPTEN